MVSNTKNFAFETIIISSVETVRFTMNHQDEDEKFISFDIKRTSHLDDSSRSILLQYNPNSYMIVILN